MRILCKAPQTIHPTPCASPASGPVPGGAVSVERERVPGDAVPGDAVPGDAVPRDAVPDDAVPDDAVPGDAIPGVVIPGGSIPEQRFPGAYRPKNAAGQRILRLQQRANKDWRHGSG